MIKERKTKSQNVLHDCDHTQQHCYFADMAYETKCVWIACPYQQSSNAGLLPWCCQLMCMCMWLFFISFCVSCSDVLSWKRCVGRCACTYVIFIEVNEFGAPLGQWASSERPVSAQWVSSDTLAGRSLAQWSPKFINFYKISVRAHTSSDPALST